MALHLSLFYWKLLRACFNSLLSLQTYFLLVISSLVSWYGNVKSNFFDYMNCDWRESSIFISLWIIFTQFLHGFLNRSLREDYKRRSPYLSYLVRCRQGLLTTLAHQERILMRSAKVQYKATSSRLWCLSDLFDLIWLSFFAEWRWTGAFVWPTLFLFVSGKNMIKIFIYFIITCLVLHCRHCIIFLRLWWF
jgi:hypothetical protein